jgi:hypothetical protein
MIATVEDGKLVIRIPLQAPTPSASGKTFVVATSKGNKVTDVEVAGKPVTIGVNAYISK